MQPPDSMISVPRSDSLVRALAMGLVALSVLVGCSSIERGTERLQTIASGGREIGPDTFRGVFVTRFDYHDAGDVRRILRQCAEMGFTDVIWQARVNADALYASPIEPWCEDLAGPERGSVGPGFDPLEVAVREAHAYGLRLHAWVNVLTLWRGATPPQDLSHPWHRHPEWRLVDQAGRAYDAGDGVLYVNVARDDVHDHIVRVCADIVGRYQVDGLHLGEARFPLADPGAEQVVPADPESVAAYARETGRAGLSSVTQRAAYRDWLRDRITRLVRRIHDESLRGRPGVVLSAATLPTPERARGELQDAGRWMREGTLDAIVPAIYVTRTIDLYGPLEAWIAETRDRVVYTGIGAFGHAMVDETIEQVDAARRGAGFALYGYSTFFDSSDPAQAQGGTAQQERVARRTRLARSFAEYDARNPRTPR